MRDIENKKKAKRTNIEGVAESLRLRLGWALWNLGRGIERRGTLHKRMDDVDYSFNFPQRYRSLPRNL